MYFKARGLRDLEDEEEREAAAAESMTAQSAASSRSLSSTAKFIGEVISFAVVFEIGEARVLL